jgi:hypothetical protein
LEVYLRNFLKEKELDDKTIEEIIHPPVEDEPVEDTLAKDHFKFTAAEWKKIVPDGETKDTMTVGQVLIVADNIRMSPPKKFPAALKDKLNEQIEAYHAKIMDFGKEETDADNSTESE